MVQGALTRGGVMVPRSHTEGVRKQSDNAETCAAANNKNKNQEEDVQRLGVCLTNYGRVVRDAMVVGTYQRQAQGSRPQRQCWQPPTSPCFLSKKETR